MNKVKFHTVEQPDSDTTTFVLSCNRLDVLSKTLQSFHDTQDYITKMVIVDDSAEPDVFEKLVEEYGDYCDVICFPRNRSQWWAMDFMVSYCDSDYIFYLEDDWELIQPGYLNKSKAILEKYREIGVVDISWRTFEFQGIDSYEKKLIDGEFFWKKPWKITDYHLAWHAWCGSPNLRRRDDLIMLGRVEKWHNEWNIDRKFTALGFKGAYLNGEYARHLGDHCSRMAGQRPDDSKVPYDFYPKELLANRRAPYINFREMDWIYEYPADVTLVTALVDLGRDGRDFVEHYLKGLDSLLSVRNPLVVYADPIYHQWIINRRKELSIATSNNRVEVKPLTLKSLEENWHFKDFQDIITKDEWINQAEWIKGSALDSNYYVPLTIEKLWMLAHIADTNPMGSKRFYWIDAGMYNSFGIQEPITNFDFLKLPKDKFAMSSYPYIADKEIHGYNIDIMTEIAGKRPDYVCRATIFGGSKDQIKEIVPKYDDVIRQSLAKGAIGTEEALFTMLDLMYPDEINRYHMPNGGIQNYLNTIRKVS